MLVRIGDKELHRKFAPTKSTMRRPSENLPEGYPKKVSPYGKLTGPIEKEDDKPPVSELESPRLKMAGKLHAEDEAGSKRNKRQLLRRKSCVIS